MTTLSTPYPAVGFMEHEFSLQRHESHSDIQCVASPRGLVTNDLREDWLQARRLGITASGFSELVKKDGTPSGQREKALLAKITGIESNPFPSRAQQLGHEFEPIIAARIQERFGIDPNSYLMAASVNPRFLATPDGISETRVGEYKTSIKSWGHNLQTYYRQVQWQLFVADRGAAIFAVMNPHNNNFMVGLVPRDNGEIEILKKVAADAVRELDELAMKLHS